MKKKNIKNPPNCFGHQPLEKGKLKWDAPLQAQFIRCIIRCSKKCIKLCEKKSLVTLTASRFLR